MKEDNLDIWIRITVAQICEEHNIILKDYKDWQRNKFFIFEELSKRHEVEMKKYLKKLNESEWSNFKGGK